MDKILIVLALVAAVINTVDAQPARKANPYHLVYEGAITENIKGKVTLNRDKILVILNSNKREEYKVC